ncbi:TPA: hypothetical protein ACSPOR_004576 [Bacillus cereus]|uniref:hypothetical protein n=1 Tax=Bacillus cereus TaxID=1396 RepID=UPI00065BEAC1|nr:hypothetical protein [Bacillus cereus]KMQ22166.1 hypothetical protein TU58_30415 [Bacillus cereus]
MQVIGLNAQSLQALGSFEYTIRRSKLVQDVLNGTYECSEMRDILLRFPIEKQIEILENQALFEAVAKMLEKNNAMILEQFKAWQLLQR